MDSKTQKEEETTRDVDRINSLPDSILYHILSFLPTKTCVALSLVCRRWRHLWEHVQVLNLWEDDFEPYEDLDSFKRFAIFVNAVLTLRMYRDIQKLCLACEYSGADVFSSNSVSTWIRAAIGPHLKDLNLILYPLGALKFVVPCTLFTCTNLVSLNLYGWINIRNISLVHLPSLKVLKLGIDSLDCIESFLHGCPILETLDLSLSTKSITKLRFPPSLRRLNFNVVYENVGPYLEFDTPFLNYLSISQRFAPSSCSFGDFHRVIEANLDVYVPNDFLNMFLMLMRSISRVKHLVLGFSTTEQLLRAPTLDIPEFHNLKRLELIFPYFNLSFVVNILEKCHMLQFFTIQNENLEPSILRSKGKKQRSAPSFNVSNLAFIHYKGYHGFADELEFVTYILQRGIVLESMIISTDGFLDIKKKYKILKKLSSLQRSSNKCNIKFD